MSAIPKSSLPRSGSLLPAILADAELDHVERMVQYTSRAQAAHMPRGIDGEYWKKRLRMLEATYDLVASQRSRVTRLFELLEAGAAQVSAATTAGNVFML
ncbi:hypothetical protein [Paraburkholderia sp. J67]|uniref:hypothetical protein n=1 Tax=Paraburkholderia sp. J67 TaxID=2805435 RepID=UPI002ABD4F79|nr:hypothetical protein [Paraburkholderia sp. J67]